ncbi:unnamed protein product, partial [Ectocarpus sp. 8 AP-2014]
HVSGCQHTQPPREGEGAEDQGRAQDDGTHRSCSHRLLGVPLRLPLLLCRPAHGDRLWHPIREQRQGANVFVLVCLLHGDDVILLLHRSVLQPRADG